MSLHLWLSTFLTILLWHNALCRSRQLRRPDASGKDAGAKLSPTEQLEIVSQDYGMKLYNVTNDGTLAPLLHSEVEKLLANYDPDLMPQFAEPFSHKTHITVGLHYRSFGGIDESAEIAHLGLAVTLRWTDSRLTCPGFFTISARRVWVPTLEFLDTTSKPAVTDDAVTVSNGTLVLLQTYDVAFGVDFSQIFFPFDTQRIRMIFGDRLERYSLVLDSAESVHQKNSKFGPSGAFETLSFRCKNDTDEAVKCELKIRRNGIPFVFCYIVPIFCILLIAYLGIVTQQQIVNRAQVAITACVALAVHLTSISRSMPSKYHGFWEVPWFISFICLTIVCLLATILLQQAATVTLLRKPDIVGYAMLCSQMPNEQRRKTARFFRRAAIAFTPFLLLVHCVYWAAVVGITINSDS